MQAPTNRIWGHHTQPPMPTGEDRGEGRREIREIWGHLTQLPMPSGVRPVWYPRGMPRLARAVVPGFPHHVTQRGNRRQQTFFGTEDYLLYLALMSEWCQRCSVGIWAYCLMPNHVHLIAVPSTADGLRRAIGEA